MNIDICIKHLTKSRNIYVYIPSVEAAAVFHKVVADDEGVVGEEYYININICSESLDQAHGQ